MPKLVDIKAFVPAKNLAHSIRFYSDLGFRTNWSNEDAAEMEAAGSRFLLQSFYVKELKKTYPSIMLRPPELQPWGLRVLYLSDPTGVLWHIAGPPAG